MSNDDDLVTDLLLVQLLDVIFQYQSTETQLLVIGMDDQRVDTDVGGQLDMANLVVVQDGLIDDVFMGEFGDPHGSLGDTLIKDLGGHDLSNQLLIYKLGVVVIVVIIVMVLILFGRDLKVSNEQT